MRFGDLDSLLSAVGRCHHSSKLRLSIGAAVLIAGLTGCGSTPPKPEPQAAKAAAAAAPAPAPEVKAPAEPPLSIEVQQAFQAARSALIAGRTADAERRFLALAKSNPELSGPHANLAVIYRQAGKLPEAAAALERAIAANPQHAVYFNQLGIVYRMQGQFTKARDAYDQAIALDPNYTLAYLNLGILYDLYLGDSKRALELYDRYLALSPTADERVQKWVSDIKNRTPRSSVAARKEQG
ncbi:MAG TPA: tetratricopeptide repeat protein [Burkholderiaceae bacterium]|nr:tetratricopeptide repeat protein [Burkholderiaceae bacterium]